MQKPRIVLIPGTTKLHRLDENLGALDVELTSDDLREIEVADQPSGRSPSRAHPKDGWTIAYCARGGALEDTISRSNFHIPNPVKEELPTIRTYRIVADSKV